MSNNSRSDDDSTGSAFNLDQPDILEIRETGPRIVVGFGKQHVPDDHCLAVYREKIRQLIKQHNAKEVVFDLKAFQKIQSGTLGLIASIHNEGVKVGAIHVAPDIREVFELSNLNRIVKISETGETS